MEVIWTPRFPTQDIHVDYFRCYLQGSLTLDAWVAFPLHGWIYNGLFPNKSQQVVEWNFPPPIMPLQKLRDVSIKCSFCPQIKMQLYMQYIYIYTVYIVTSAKLNLFVGNYFKSRLRKCFKEKVSAKKSFHIYTCIYIYIFRLCMYLYIIYIYPQNARFFPTGEFWQVLFFLFHLDPWGFMLRCTFLRSFQDELWRVGFQWKDAKWTGGGPSFHHGWSMDEVERCFILGILLLGALWSFHSIFLKEGVSCLKKTFGSKSVDGFLSGMWMERIPHWMIKVPRRAAKLWMVQWFCWWKKSGQPTGM